MEGEDGIVPVLPRAGCRQDIEIGRVPRNSVSDDVVPMGTQETGMEEKDQ
jgi:hypothetical protein